MSMILFPCRSSIYAERTAHSLGTVQSNTGVPEGTSVILKQAPSCPM